MAQGNVAKKLKTLPPSDHETMMASALFKALVRAGRWSYPQIGNALGMNTDQSVKDWASGRSTPKSYVARLEEFVFANAASKKIGDAWWKALVAAWERDTRRMKNITDGSGQQRPPLKALVKALQEKAGSDRQLTNLPALFEVEQPFPLADAYVELRIVKAAPITQMPDRLEPGMTLAEKVRRRTEQRHARRSSPKDVLDNIGLRSRLILGAPGSGKSSLLRRLALDIAAGQWETAAVPLFVEARAYADRRRSEPSLTLIDYACQSLGAQHADAIRELLSDPAIAAKDRAILLIDGLDEIATDRDAVSAVYATLANSLNGVAWIATTRPAGLMASLNEDQRYEMTELDPEAVQRLIENWCRVCALSGLHIDPEALRWELHRLPGIREMSTNPFLLTALCYLKSTAPNEQLPNSRIAVYESLIERIARQAQTRHNDPTVLSPRALRDLSEFACFLYQRPSDRTHGIVQIFRETLWHEFARSASRGVETNFERQILPGRLLTAWHAADRQYHFLHLTLQEHLIARAMIDRKVTDALAFRFVPAWRPVFRFYGALLLHRDKHTDFVQLTTALFQSRDISNLMLITLAEIFSDAGVRDTQTLIGVDLRDAILKAIRADHAVGMEAFIDALALMDPDWLTQQTINEMDALIAVAVAAANAVSNEERYPGHLATITGRDAGSPYLRLARARTPSAMVAIENAFWGEDQTRSIMAAFAYAEVASAKQLAHVVKAATRIDDLSGELAVRYYAFALASRSLKLLPFLDRLTEHLAEHATDPFFDALSLVADIGGPKAKAILLKRLLFELRRHDGDHHIEMCVRAAAQLGDQYGRAVLEAALKQAPSDHWRDHLRVAIDTLSPAGMSYLAARMTDPAASDVVLAGFADAASYGIRPGNDVIDAIKAYAAQSGGAVAFDLAVLEHHMLEAGAPPQLCELLLTIATDLLDALREPQLGTEADIDITTTLGLVLEVLGKGRWLPARGLAESIIDDTTLSPAVVERAVTMVGLILETSGDEGMIARLEQILYDEPRRIDAYEVTLAIGRIKLESLFQRRGAHTATSTLQQIAAENDWLILDDAWVDRNGKETRWDMPPRRVLCRVSPARQNIADALAHELSRWSLFLTPDCAADCCVAALVIEPLDQGDGGLNDTELQLLKASGAQVYRIPAASLASAREIARIIGPVL